MAATTTTSSSSSSCMGFFRTGSSHPARPRTRATPKKAADGVAMWLINGVATAFFASLERCCIRIQTHEDSEADEEKDAPLIYNDGNWTAATEDRRATRRAGNKGRTLSHEALCV
uniref:Uncharacterized protein n=1 Tax=Kalanchoe fedtschenkoi TaxID=63787 RepID=A0A7N0UKB0_KALFE